MIPLIEWIREYKEEKYTLISDVQEEMEKDGYELVEQVVILILGGILGGQAFRIALADYGMLLTLILYLFLLLVGVLSLGILHFYISYNRIKSS